MLSFILKGSRQSGALKIENIIKPIAFTLIIFKISEGTLTYLLTAQKYALNGKVEHLLQGIARGAKIYTIVPWLMVGRRGSSTPNFIKLKNATKTNASKGLNVQCTTLSRREGFIANKNITE